MDIIHVPGFDIKKEIGEGGSSTIYRAEYELMGNDVALKVAKGPEFANQIRTEAKTQFNLSNTEKPHENIVKVFSSGDVDGDSSKPFFAMELMDGSLNDSLKNGSRVSIDLGLSILKQCLNALGYAHTLPHDEGEGFIHGDIKAGNILLGDGGIFKLSDFGLGRKYIEREDGLELSGNYSMTRLDQIGGTLGYIAPEIPRDKKIDKRSDIYSLGQLAIKMLTGDFGEVGSTPRETNEEIPEWFNRILLRMVKGNPDKRFQAVAEILEQVELAGKPLVISIDNSHRKAAYDHSLHPEVFNNAVSKMMELGVDGVDLSMFNDWQRASVYMKVGMKSQDNFFSKYPSCFNRRGNIKHLTHKGKALIGTEARIVGHVAEKFDDLKRASDAFAELRNQYLNEDFASKLKDAITDYIRAFEMYHDFGRMSGKEDDIGGWFFTKFLDHDRTTLNNSIEINMISLPSPKDILDIGVKTYGSLNDTERKRWVADMVLGYESRMSEVCCRGFSDKGDDGYQKSTPVDMKAMRAVEDVYRGLNWTEGLREVSFLYIHSKVPHVVKRGKKILEDIGKGDYSQYFDQFPPGN